jgi:hypothetical protein
MMNSPADHGMPIRSPVIPSPTQTSPASSPEASLSGTGYPATANP